MPMTEVNLADRSGNLLESHKNYDPRIVLFYFLVAALLITLVIGLGYQQLRKVGEYADAERQQTQRRIVFPGPRGNIEDRNGRVLVGNRPRFSVRLLLDQLRPELRREYIRIRNNYRAIDDKDIPNRGQLEEIARVSVVQQYLDRINTILGRDEKVNPVELKRHFARDLLLPYTLLDDLEPSEYARLLERLPVNSPAQVYTFSSRHYPYKSAAAHTLGYVGTTEAVEIEDFPGDDLKTFKMLGTIGRAGIEQQFDSVLQGESGGAIFRVDPTGNRINPPLRRVLPKKGKNVRLSLDVEMQLAAEEALTKTEMAGSAVALDIKTGEVYVLASKPDYDLTLFSPRISSKTWADAEARGAFVNRAIQGAYAPGSTFKILTTVAGFHSGFIGTETRANCTGVFHLGRARFDCHNREAHGEIGIGRAIEKSCNVFFYTWGYEMGPQVLASEAKRFHLDRRTGIELPAEASHMSIPDPEWKERVRKERWVGGDTVQMSIGQGMVAVTPLQMACFMASVARNEVWTQPTILHRPDRPTQRTEPIGMTPDQRDTLLKSMHQVTLTGTARILTQNKFLPRIPDLTIGAKTGTAQRMSAKGMVNVAWLIAFAPVDNPQIAIAVAVEGDAPGEEYGGGMYASPVAHGILKAWWAKKNPPSNARAAQVRSE